MPNLAQLRTQIRTATLVPEAVVSDPSLDAWINEGLYKVSSRDRWSWLEDSDSFTTTAATQSYQITAAVASDVDKIVAIYSNTKRRRLQQMSAQEAMEVWGGDPPSGANADAYYVWGGYIYLLPVPDTSSVQYNVLYYKNPTALSADGDSPPWDVIFHRVLAHYGEMRVWQFEEELSKAQAAEIQFYRVLEEMQDWYRDIADDRPWVVGLPQGRRGTRTNTPFLDGLT